MALTLDYALVVLLTLCATIISAQEPVINNLGVTIEINETANGDLIYTVDATDSDGDILNYTISAGNGDGNFEIDSSGNLYVVVDPINLDADAISATLSYVLTIEVTDGENTTTAALQIDILEKNEVPEVANVPASMTVQEDDLSSRLLHSTGASPATDDEGGTLSYECTFSPSDDGSFYCDTGNGDLYTNLKPNYTASSYSVGVRIYDGTDYSNYGYVTVNVNNVWGDVPFFNNLPNTTTVSEDAALGDILYVIEVWDPDNETHGEVSLVIDSISTGDNTTFALSSLSLNLTAALDYEAVPSYTITFKACDVDGCTYETLTVNVENVDEPPTALATSVITIPENTLAPWILLPGWNISDADGETSFTFTLEPSADSVFFDISSPDGNLTFSSATLLDYEDTTRPDHTLTFNVLIDDGTGQTSTVEVTVQIEDVNEFDPLIEFDEYEVEVTEGLTLDILTFHTSDEDGGEVFGKVTKFIVGEPGNQFFRVVTNSDGSGTLETWNFVDLEALDDDDLSFIVYAQDGGGREDATTIKMKIINVNEFPPVLTNNPLKFRIDSNAAVGTLVGRVGVTDGDLIERLTYHMIDNTTAPFFIGYLDGNIGVNGELQAGTTYTFYAYVEDSGEPPLTSSIVEIQVTTYDGEKILVDWEIQTDEYYYPSDIAQFEENLRATCEPCTPVVAGPYVNDNGNTVLKVYILKGSSTEDNPTYMSKEEMLSKYTTDGKKTPTDAAAALAPKGTVVSINEAYVTPPSNWLVDTIPGNVVLALICLVGFGLITTAIAALLDRYWWHNRAENRKYSTLA